MRARHRCFHRDVGLVIQEPIVLRPDRNRQQPSADAAASLIDQNPGCSQPSQHDCNIVSALGSLTCFLSLRSDVSFDKTLY
jgi:hypothetical protein